TVLFSSHLLDEVERVSDHVALIDHGRLAVCAALDDLKEAHRCLTLHFAEPRSQPPNLTGALAWQGGGREWTTVCSSGAGLREEAACLGARVVAERLPSLEDVFVARVGARTVPTREEV